ncbi:MAG: ATP-dependent RNA helicase RhlB [Pseudomonadales bacterium]|nr:ATP-dependent RNA helicase RhlB [Pseudomonadales bacterium]
MDTPTQPDNNDNNLASNPQTETEQTEEPKVPFTDFNLDPRLLAAIDKIGFTHCSPIQAKSLPVTLKGTDIIGKAQTGTGKTAAFLISTLQYLLTEPEQEERYNGEPRTLILAPTRELALQIEKDAKEFVKGTPISVMSVVGGMDYRGQKNRLNNEIIDILVGTPGRILDFIGNKDLYLTEIEVLVIDEADRMLDMGFIPDIKKIIRTTPKKEYRQTLLFSATFTEDIINLSNNWTHKAEFVEIEPDSIASANVEKKVYLTTTEEKITLLYNIVTQKNLDKVMVFANRRDETRNLMDHLKRLGVRTALLSGDVPQNKRLRTLENFREGKIQVLVATDVAGRGIHIDGISHVVNYTLPEDPEDYVHRIGRTGRAGTSGISISFACEEDAFEIPKIEALLGEKLDYQQPEEELLAPLPPH